jgi:hypothetical protein
LATGWFWRSRKRLEWRGIEWIGYRLIRKWITWHLGRKSEVISSRISIVSCIWKRMKVVGVEIRAFRWGVWWRDSMWLNRGWWTSCCILSCSR